MELHGGEQLKLRSENKQNTVADVQPSANTQRSKLVLFIHGWRGKPDTAYWARFPELIIADQELKELYDVALFGYDTAISSWHPAPPIGQIADELRSRIETDWTHYKEIVIIAHSQGGLIARRYIADRFRDKKACLVRRVLYLTTPHIGAIADAKYAKRIPFLSDQTRGLGFNSEDLQRLFIDEAATGADRHIKTKFVVAAKDGAVGKMSAWGSHGPGDYLVVQNATHESIHKPDNPDHPAFKIARSFLLGEENGPAGLVASDYTSPLLEQKYRDLCPDQQERHRFAYWARALPFIGRNAEFEQINKFLSDPNREFSWMLLHGPGGTGKSRLALEIVLALQTDWWHAGFLNQLHKGPDWPAWQPMLPTLLVIDYAARDPDRVSQILQSLAVRDLGQRLKHPVRVLLIEREDQGRWLERILDAHKFVAGEETRAANLPLAPLSDPWPIFQYTWSTQAAAKGRSLPSKKRTLARLKEIDEKCRPLFAYLMADALVRHGDERRWSKEALLEDVVVHEKRFWRDAARNSGVGERFDREERALALATMAGGLSVNFLKNVEDDLLPKWRRDSHPELFRVMCGLSIHDQIRQLEPDIVGEFFVLELLERHSVSARELVDLAWQLSPFESSGFAARCYQDFPHHKAIKTTINETFENSSTRNAWAIFAANAMPSIADQDADHALTVYRKLKMLAREFPQESAIQQCESIARLNIFSRVSYTHGAKRSASLAYELDALDKEILTGSEYRLKKAKDAADSIRNFYYDFDYLARYRELAALAKEFPKERELRLEQARAAADLSAHLQKEDIEGAQNLYRELALLANEFPEDREIRAEQARSAGNLWHHSMFDGDLCFQDTDDALKFYRDLKMLVEEFYPELSKNIIIDLK